MISFQVILRKHILNPKDMSEKAVGMETGLLRRRWVRVSPKPPGLHELVSEPHSLTQSHFLEKEGTLYLMHRTRDLSKPAGPYAWNRGGAPLMIRIQALEFDRLGCESAFNHLP